MDEILENKIFDFADELEAVENPQVGDERVLNITDTYQIKAVYIQNEDNEFVYNMILFNGKTEEEIDSIYCDVDAEELENIIYFFIEEYSIV